MPETNLIDQELVYYYFHTVKALEQSEFYIICPTLFYPPGTVLSQTSF